MHCLCPQACPPLIFFFSSVMIWSFLYKQLALVAYCLEFVIVQIFLEQSILFF